jgi:hypothetical protein
LATLWSLDPLLVWGLFERGLGLVLLISFGSLTAQVVPAVGEHSIVPLAKRLAKLRVDFPTWKRVLYFPSLYWFGQRDAYLRAIPALGLAAAMLVIWGGPWSVAALAVCYVCYLSLDLPMGLVLPWDTLLFETMVLALFLPATHALPQLAIAHAPAAALAWAFRLLLFRVMFGFGKQKFLGSRRQDLAYLKGFFLNQPLLSPGGWYAHRLPDVLLKLSVLFMFVAEIPAPFFAFFPGVLSVVCALVTIMLMLGIQLTGNFGYFSLLTIVDTIPLFDQLTPRALHLSMLFSSGEPYLVNAFVLFHTLAAVITFPFNSWLAQGWHLWAFWYQLPRWVQGPLNVIRWLHPLRWVHPYGVFPPNTTPSVKITLLLELSWDKTTWHEVTFKYAPSNPNSAPHFVAPHHPRGEQAIIYDTFGMNYTSLLSTMVAAWDPSAYAMRSPSVLFCQAVLRGAADGLMHCPALQQHSERPRAVRVSTVMLEAVDIARHRASGVWWSRRYIGPHTPPQEIDPEFDADMLGEPELWHFDAIFWRRRSKLQPLLTRAAAAEIDPLQLCLLDSDLTVEDVTRFWDELVPLIGEPQRQSFDTLPAVVQQFRGRYSRPERRALYRLLGRFGLILIARLEPLYLHRGLSPLIPVRTYFHLWMLVHHIIGCGKQAYLEAVADPRSVVKYVPALTPQTGLYALSLFRFDEMTFDAQKLRLLETYFYPHDPAQKRKISDQLKTDDMSQLKPAERRIASMARAVSGVYNLMPFIREGFRGPDFDLGYPELYPLFEELASGEVVVGRYAEPDPERPLAPDLKSLDGQS